MNWINNKTTYKVFTPNVAHVYVIHQANPLFNYIDVLKIKPDLSHVSTIDFALNLMGYKSSGSPDSFGMQEVLIFKTLPSKMTSIKNFKTSSNSFEKIGKFEPFEDFMRQMIFNDLQIHGGKNYIDTEKQTHIRNYDVWTIK